MKQKAMTRIGLAGLLLAGTIQAQQPRQPAIDLQAAIRTQTVDGDLNAAIEQYKVIVSRYGKSNRSVTADALIRMAGCYEKLGTAQAREIYQRVVSEFRDQTESVTTAQARLAALQPTIPDAPVYRRVWSGPNVDTEGTVSADGRFLSYPDWSTGNLALRDLVTGTDRTLTNDGSPRQYAERSVISPDGTQVVFARFDGKDHYELRLASTTRTRPGPSQPLYANQEDEWLAPNDWSPDGKWIAVQFERKDGTALIGLVSAEDGSLRVLKSLDWRGPGKIAFSPTGKYIAYDLPADEDSLQRDIFVLAVDGSQETQAVLHPANDTVVGWSPNGSLLLFSSNRTGNVGLWSVPVLNGRPQGAPALLKRDLGEAFPMGLTAAGALYVGQKVRGPEVYVRSFDFATGKWLSDPVSPVAEYVFNNRSPVWSPDGTELAYVSRHNVQGPPDYRLCILSTKTKKVRALSTGLAYIHKPRWSPDGRFISVNGGDRKGRRGLFQVDAQSGKSTLIAQGAGVWGNDWSPDGKKVYYRRSAGFAADYADLIERDMATGVERQILRLHRFNAPNVSPDGEWIAIDANVEPSGPNKVLLIRVSDGESRELARHHGNVFCCAWTPDSLSILFRLGRTDVIVPVEGGDRRELDLPAVPSGISIHPDGRTVAFSIGRNTYEVWALENFLPTAARSR